MYLKEGLLKTSSHMDSGYTLYSPEAVDHAKRIRDLQEQRLSLGEIRKKMGQD